MLHIVEGDLLDSGCDVLVNTVNCVGAHGRGLAKQFAHRYAGATAQYEEDCYHNRYAPGDVHIYRPAGTPVLLFAATKDHWRNPSQLDWVAQCIAHIKMIMTVMGKQQKRRLSVALPPLGAGLGGLNGEDVLHLVYGAFNNLDDPFDVYYFLPR